MYDTWKMEPWCSGRKNDLRENSLNWRKSFMIPPRRIKVNPIVNIHCTYLLNWEILSFHTTIILRFMFIIVFLFLFNIKIFNIFSNRKQYEYILKKYWAFHWYNRNISTIYTIRCLSDPIESFIFYLFIF